MPCGTRFIAGTLCNIKMKRLSQFIIVSLLPLLGFGQDSAYSLDSREMTQNDSLYLTALEKFTIEIDSFYNKYGDKDFEDVLYVRYNDYLNGMPDSINGYKIVFLGLANRKKHFKENQNELMYIEISPLSLENDKFNITLTPYHAELQKRKHLLLGLSSWTKVYFRYDSGKLLYESTKNGGI